MVEFGVLHARHLPIFLRILIIFSTLNPNGGAIALCLSVKANPTPRARCRADRRITAHPTGPPRRPSPPESPCQPKKKPAVAHPEFAPAIGQQPVSFPTMNPPQLTRILAWGFPLGLAVPGLGILHATGAVGLGNAQTEKGKNLPLLDRFSFLLGVRIWPGCIDISKHSTYNNGGRYLTNQQRPPPG